MDKAMGRHPVPSSIAIIGSRGYPSTYGGFETLVRMLAPYLVARGHEVTVYGRGRGWSSTVVDGIRCVQTLGIDRKTTSTLSFGFTSSVHASLRRNRPDAALILNPANGHFLRIFGMAGIRTVVNVDGLEWERSKWNRLAKKVFFSGATQVAQRSDVVVADSEELGAIWRGLFGIEASFIPYGGEITRSANEQLVIDTGLTPRRYFMVVARLVPENNIDMFLECAASIAERTGCTPVVVGTANGRSELQDRVERAAASGDLRWFGHVSDQALLAALWSNCAVYVHGHSVGGTNPALLQAMGCGAPVVAFDCRFNREVLRGTESRFFADAESAEQAILDVLGDEALRERLRRQGRDRIESSYNWGDVCAAYERALVGRAGG